MIDQAALSTSTTAAAVVNAHADAGVLPPTIASASPIVPLQRLLQGQPLKPPEIAGLTCATATAFLGQEVGVPVEIDGPPTERLSGSLHTMEEAV